MNFNVAKATVKRALEMNHALMVTGAPGVGKSSLVEELQKELGWPCRIIHLVVRERVDFGGAMWVVQPKGKDAEAIFIPMEDLKFMIEAKEPSIVFFDDLGQAEEDVQKALMQIILARRINGFEISSQVRFIAATNRRQDKAGVAGILEPVKSRFVSIINMDASVSSWCEWAIRAGLPLELAGFVRMNPDLFDDSNYKPTKDLVNSVCPRTLEHAGQIMMSGYPKEAFLELMEGAAGKDFTVRFLAFLEIFREIPDPRKVLADPENAPIPSANNVRIALCLALIEMLSTGKDVRNFFTYINRLEGELGMISILTAAQKHPSLVAETTEYVSWLSENQQYM